MEELVELARKIEGRKILLQVPEGLKHHVDEMVDVLTKMGKEVFVDIDPTYGSCDIRVNEAKQVGADVIIHVGHAPMLKLPNVYYAYWKKGANVDAIRETVKQLVKDRIACLVSSVNYAWILDHLRDIRGVKIGKGGWRIPVEGAVVGCDTTACNVDADINIFVGDGYFHPLAVWVNTRRRTFLVYPDGRFEEVSFEGVIRKRLAIIGSVEGRRVGIIVSSKYGQNRRELAEELYHLSKKRGYTPSLYVSDYLEPSYLMGLRDDFFVYTGCPRVPIDDMERYDKPILTPEEFLYKLGVLKEYRIGWITRVPPQGDEA